MHILVIVLFGLSDCCINQWLSSHCFPLAGASQCRPLELLCGFSIHHFMSGEQRWRSNKKP